MTTETPQSPGLSDILRRSLDDRLLSLNVSIPGRVEAFDSEQNRADVKPLIKVGRLDMDTGEREASSIPVIPEVPVILYGSGGVRVKIPVSKGDTGLLVFVQSSMDLWLAKSGEEVDPGDDRRFDLTDAIFIPGLTTFSGAGDADPQIEFTTSGEIHAGGTEALALRAEIASLETWLLGHIHVGVTPGPPASVSGIPSAGVPIGGMPIGAGTDTLKGS